MEHASDSYYLGLAVAAICSYFIGSLNPASWIAKARGIDLAGSGSGNPGATNAGRVMGRKTGILVMVFDVLKGVVPVLLFDRLFGYPAGELAGFFAILGHITSPFLRGKGGKGVATTLGVILAVNPIWVVPMLVVFAIVYLITKRVGLGSVAAAITLIVASLALAQDWPTKVFGAAVGILVVVRHQANIRAAIAGVSHFDSTASSSDSGDDT